MASTVSLTDFTKQVDKFLEDCTKDVSENLEEGLDEAQGYLIDQMRSASPKETGDYAAHWHEGKSGKGYRRVVNDKKVEWKNGHDTHLAGILEYSTNHNHPHIEATKRASRRKILQILKDSVTKDA